MHISLIVAMSENRVIGQNGGMPWHLPEDLKYFRKVTLGKPVVMGRKTYASIGKALPGRLNIVITRDKDFFADGVQVVNSIPEALEYARNYGSAGVDEVMIIGGGQIYAESLKYTNRIYLTEIHATIDGDTLFPELPSSQWVEISRRDADNENTDNPALSFVTLERIPNKTND